MTDRRLGTSLDPHLDHLDTDTLADLIENLLPAADAHRSREHVKACPDCQTTYDALMRLTADLAEEGRADIPMPVAVAEHLDAVIVSESVLRSSTVGVHSLAQLREQPRRHLPRLLLAAAGVVMVTAAGVAVVKTADQGAAGISPTDAPTVLVTLATSQVGPEVQRLLEETRGPVLRGGAGELACARDFAEGQPNTSLRLVQPSVVDGERVTVLGMLGSSSHEVRVYAVTGCATNPGPGPRQARVKYVTTVTLRNR